MNKKKRLRHVFLEEALSRRQRLLGVAADEPPAVEQPPAAVSAEHFFVQAEDGIRGLYVTGVQTCALPISCLSGARCWPGRSARSDAPGSARRARDRKRVGERESGAAGGRRVVNTERT